MTTNWPTDAELDALMASAENTRSKAVRFDPEGPGGFKALTEQEDAELINSIALPRQRHTEDREQLVQARDRAERAGDLDRADELAENLRALDDERARDQRADPRLPTRDQIDRLWQRGDEVGWTEPTARAVEYLDARRDTADERRAAFDRGDLGEVDRLDRHQARLDRGLREYLGDPELEDEERER